MFSGKIIFNFGIAERLRTLRYSIFTGGVTPSGAARQLPQGGAFAEKGNFPATTKAVPLGKVA